MPLYRYRLSKWACHCEPTLVGVAIYLRFKEGGLDFEVF